MYDIIGGYMAIIKFDDLKYLSRYYHQFEDFKNDTVVVDYVKRDGIMFVIGYKGKKYHLYNNEFKLIKDNKINRLLYGKH